jgi:hypothetical protein
VKTETQVLIRGDFCLGFGGMGLETRNDLLQRRRITLE